MQLNSRDSSGIIVRIGLGVTAMQPNNTLLNQFLQSNRCKSIIVDVLATTMLPLQRMRTE